MMGISRFLTTEKKCNLKKMLVVACDGLQHACSIKMVVSNTLNHYKQLNEINNPTQQLQAIFISNDQAIFCTVSENILDLYYYY